MWAACGAAAVFISSHLFGGWVIWFKQINRFRSPSREGGRQRACGWVEMSEFLPTVFPLVRLYPWDSSSCNYPSTRRALCPQRTHFSRLSFSLSLSLCLSRCLLSLSRVRTRTLVSYPSYALPL